MRPLHVHFGHMFFGAGNIGDDLMLGGWLAALRASGQQLRLTCATASLQAMSAD
jgi:polysaccharide pyruvyl transferase WcaK-like protein